MERKPLTEYIDKILEICAEDCQIGCDDPIEQEYSPETNSFYFEEDGYLISGSFDIVGRWGSCGDGYWEPCETYVTNVKVTSVDVEEAFWYDPETDEEFQVPQDEIDLLIKQIENSVPDMVEY